jgi:hypothetical protein
MKLRRTYVEDHLPKQTDTAANEKGVQAVFPNCLHAFVYITVQFMLLIILAIFNNY